MVLLLGLAKGSSQCSSIERTQTKTPFKNESKDFVQTKLGRIYSSQLSFRASLVAAQLVKNLPAMWETCVRSLGLGRSPGEGNSYLLQYSDLENPMDCIVYGVAKSRTQLSDFHFTSLLHYSKYWEKYFRWKKSWIYTHTKWRVLEMVNTRINIIFIFFHV